MTELSEQPTQEPTVIVRRHGGFWFGVIILLIVACMAGIGFYLFQQLRSQQEDLGNNVNKEDSRLEELRSQINTYQAQLAALTAEVTAKDNRLTQTLNEFSRSHTEKVENTRKELTEAVSQVQRQLGKTRGDWLIADAEYLLSVANERLHLIGDVNTTREALEAADQRLRESGDAGVFKIREQIAKELALLKSINLPDIVGLYGTIQSLEESANQLELILPYAGKARAPVSEAKNEDGLFSAFKGVVTIRHIDKTVKEILTPEEARFIHEQLRVKLEMIKIALVQHNDALYQSSIKDTQAWLIEHFAKTDAVTDVANELTRLSNVKIRSQFPDIGTSLKMLRDITRLRLETDKTTEAAKETKPTVSTSTETGTVVNSVGER